MEMPSRNALCIPRCREADERLNEARRLDVSSGDVLRGAALVHWMMEQN